MDCVGGGFEDSGRPCGGGSRRPHPEDFSETFRSGSLVLGEGICNSDEEIFEDADGLICSAYGWCGATCKPEDTYEAKSVPPPTRGRQCGRVDLWAMRCEGRCEGVLELAMTFVIEEEADEVDLSLSVEGCKTSF